MRGLQTLVFKFLEKLYFFEQFVNELISKICLVRSFHEKILTNTVVESERKDMHTKVRILMNEILFVLMMHV